MWYEYVGLVGCALFWLWAIMSCRSTIGRLVIGIIIGSLLVSALCNMVWPPHVNVHKAGYEQCVYMESMGTQAMCSTPSGDAIMVDLTEWELERARTLLLKGSM